MKNEIKTNLKNKSNFLNNKEELEMDLRSAWLCLFMLQKTCQECGKLITQLIHFDVMLVANFITRKVSIFIYFFTEKHIFCNCREWYFTRTYLWFFIFEFDSDFIILCLKKWVKNRQRRYFYLSSYIFINISSSVQMILIWF